MYHFLSRSSLPVEGAQHITSCKTTSSLVWYPIMNAALFLEEQSLSAASLRGDGTRIHPQKMAQYTSLPVRHHPFHGRKNHSSLSA